MRAKEATARIKINRLLEASGWRFFKDERGPANIQLEPGVTITSSHLDAFGHDFETTSKGFVDFLLLDERGFPLLVLEAKSEDKNPLIGKEQARRYARSQNCRFVILSNGNLHYFWDLERGNPNPITTLPRPAGLAASTRTVPNPARLVEEAVDARYIALTQRPGFESEAGWRVEAERADFLKKNKLRILRPYQLEAMHKLQAAVRAGKDRFLLEMATGTGKTLTAAAVIKLFLRTNNATRVLFLVDRLELEDQAMKSFRKLLSNDFTTRIYKESRSEWRQAEIVISTVQSLLFDNKYQRLFSPSDFDLVISDEAHRSIGGNARAVFDYFVGWKLGLTATPRDYLKNFDGSARTTRDPRAAERRLLLDTYRTFGCESGDPTYRYSLLDGVKDGYLISPTVVDARTEVTAKLVSDEGYVMTFADDAGEEQTAALTRRQFEKRFFSEPTNALLCNTLLENALRDPISGEIGKTLVFAVSQEHAAKLTQMLNQIADKMFPGKYQSDFAVQVTSLIPDAQQFTVNFANNKLLGSANFQRDYATSKARVCVTVGMMTTGYDCPDLLNLGLFRPIFSPTDFVQIKGRGTRRHDFAEDLIGEEAKAKWGKVDKTEFKLFDFFANSEYFEEKYDYDQVLALPRLSGGQGGEGGEGGEGGAVRAHERTAADILDSLEEAKIGAEGMKIDRMLFDRFRDTVRADQTIAAAVEAGQWDRVIDYVHQEVFDKPTEHYNLQKLRRAISLDRRLSLREFLEHAFGHIEGFKGREALLDEEFAKFLLDAPPEDPDAIPAIRAFFKAYVTSDEVRHIIETKQFTDLATNTLFSTRDYRAVPASYRSLVPEYVKDYVSLNQFAA